MQWQSYQTCRKHIDLIALCKISYNLLKQVIAMI